MTMTYHPQTEITLEGHAMDFDTFVTELDAKIHGHTGTNEDPIGVIRVNESSVLWSGRNGFVQADRIGASLIGFAQHLGDDVTAASRFADEMTPENIDAMARRVVAFLNDPIAPTPPRRRATDR